MANFVVIEKDSLNKAAVNAERITLTEASIVHTKMKRDDVAEFVRDGNNLLLKLKSGEVVVIENFFVVHEDIASDLVFEEDGCVLYWFDGVSGFQNIPGLEVLLPEAGSKLGALLPWLAGAAVIGGVAAAVNNNDKKESTPSGTNTVQVKKDGTITVKVDNKGNITGTTADIEPGSEVKLTITGKDKDGQALADTTVKATVNPDGSYTAQVPPNFADGDLTVKAETADRNGKPVNAEDKLGAGKTDDPATPGDESVGLDRAITVKVDNKGNISGGTADVKPGSEVKLTITGQDKDGQPLIDTTVTATVNPDGSYTAQVPAGFADGGLTVKAETADRNGKPVNAEDKLGAGKADDPGTPGNESEGLDRVDGKITVDITDKGAITGGTTDVAPNTDVVLTITGKNAAGGDVTVTKTVKTDGGGSYSSALTPADGIADGSAVTVVASTTDRNGKAVPPATDAVAGKTDHDNNPGTPDQGGIDLVAGAITVDITDKGAITGGTTDVAPNTDVVLTITGKNAAGGDVTVTKTVKTDGSGSYSSALTPADGIAEGSAVTVVASTIDRNGKAVPPAADSVAGKADHDNNPGTPDQGGIDLVAGAITVDITDKGAITGGTTDVAPNTDVVLTITGKNAAGGDVTVTKTVKTDGSGNYTSALTPADGIADGSAVTVVASTTDRNGKAVPPATDAVAGKADHDNNPGTPDQGGLDLEDGSITVKVDNKGNITGTTADIEPGSEVKLTITGKDKDGQALADTTVKATVNPDGSYTAQVPPNFADGDLTVKAETADRNGKPVNAEDKLGAGKTDDPATPGDESVGLDRAITVKVDNKGNISGGTADVKPGSEVKLTITGQDKDGQPLIDTTVTATVNPDGSYTAQVPAGFADGGLTVKAETADRNGKPVNAEDKLGAGKADDPGTPGNESEGLDRVDGKITVDITDKGAITGGTTDVAPNTDVVLTITGKNAAGGDVTVTKTVKTDGGGSYSSALTPADGIADGSAVTVVANTTDRNGKAVPPATDAVAGKADHDNNPGTPDQGGIDLVAGAITVDITDKGAITGGTTDVAPNTDVVLTITGKNAAGGDVTVTKTVKTDGSGNYTSALTPADGIADGSAVTVVASTTDRNGKAVPPATDAVAGKADHDNNPGTPDQGGLDLEDGSITVKVDNKGNITGTTADIEPGSEVKLTITGKDKDGQALADTTVKATVNPDGSYTAQVPPNFADGDLTVKAETADRNGKPVNAEDKLGAGKTDDPATPGDESVGLDRAITVKVDNKGNISGGTADVKPGSEVKLTITGQDKDGQPLIDTTVTATVNPDGSYTAQVPAGFADGGLTVKAETADRNGKPVNAEDKLGAGKADDPGTPGNESEGLDRVDGKITVDITDKGAITGGTTDVAPNTDVVLTITGKNAAGGDVTVTKTVKTDGGGSYSSALTPADGIADGSAVTVVANTTDRNGKAVTPAQDSIAGKADHDNNPGTPDQGGIDLVAGAITVDITDKGAITGGTTDVAPNTDVVLTITGKNAAGVDVTVTKTVKTDGSGSYSSALTPADGIADGSAVTVVANTTDRNGKAVPPAADSVAGKADHDNNPGTPDQGGIDLVAGAITVDITDKGAITGGTTDVAPNTDVVLTITGKNAAGGDVTVTKTVKTDGSGNYTSALTPADGIADGSAVTVVANTTDRNGKAVPPATDAVAGKTDHDNNPGTPDQGGIDLVAGKITVDITDKGIITGGTTDVAPNTDVVLTISGKNAAGVDVTVTKTVKTDGSGNYSSALTPADGIVDGSAVTVVANTTDRNGKPVAPATDAVAGKTDHDNNPGTPDQGGIDLVAGKITVDITEKGKITGTTKDVAPNTDVVLTIAGKNAAGVDVEITRTVKAGADGKYTYQLVAGDGIAEGSAVEVEANTTDRNGKAVTPAQDSIDGRVIDDPATPADESVPGGLDLVAGKITVDITEKGKITGTTEDVAPNTDVVLTIAGKNAAGSDVTVTKTVKTDGGGNYSSALTPADGIADGSAVTVVANTTDRNGKAVPPAADSVAGKADHDNNPGTPDQGGIDLVAGKITVDITEKGIITGGTTDVAPRTYVVLTISGKNAAGIDVTVTKTVKTDGSGNYSSALTPADGIVDGSAVTVVANTTDRNGKPVAPATDAVAGKTDHDNNPGTPDQGGIDLVAGAITVDITDQGAITGGTTDVAPNTDVVLTIAGKNAAGVDVEITRTVKAGADGKYTYQLVAGDGIAEGSAVEVEANTTDRNGKAVTPAQDSIDGRVIDDPATPADESVPGGLDLVAGKITVDINDTDSTKISGTTADVAPNSTVTLKITSIGGNGETLTFTKTVPTDVNGNYSYTLNRAEGNAVDVIATVNDRNGKEQQADTVTGTSGHDILAGDIGGLKTNFAVGHNYNISIILDISGSMNRTMTNGKTRIEVAKTALQAFVDQMAQHDGIINLRITTFHDIANAVIQDVVVSNGTVTSINSEIGQIVTGGGTYPETAFPDVDNWLNSKTNGYENQIYYLTDGEPNDLYLSSRDATFANLAAKSKVFAVGVGLDVELDWVERFDNTDANGNKINNWSPTNHGEAQKIGDADKLIAYLISGSKNFISADVGNDTVKGGADADILFGDAMNTNWITGLDPLQYPKYSGYSKLTAHLKATVTGGAEPTQQQVYDYVKANYKQFIAADAADPATKGGDDTIYGGSGDDIIIAGAGNDTVYGGSGNDVISTGRGDDTIMFDVLNAADATGGNGKDTWVDYEANDKIEFGTGFFNGLLSSDLSNAGKVGAFISVANDGLGNTVVKVDRDGAGGNHTMSDLLVLENKTGVTLQDLLNNNQIIIG